MSVVIKGMVMPKNCDYCQFCIEEDVMFETEFRCSITGTYMDEDHCFPDICPIVELPENHGKLIDADRLMRVYEDRLEKVADRYGVDSSEAGILSGAMKLLMDQDVTIEVE